MFGFAGIGYRYDPEKALRYFRGKRIRIFAHQRASWPEQGVSTRHGEGRHDDQAAVSVAPTASVRPAPATPASPRLRSQLSETSDTSELSKIIADIDRIGAPIQQQECAKTFSGRSIDCIGLLKKATLHDNAFSMLFDEVKVGISKPRDPWIKVYLPIQENETLRYAQPGDIFDVTGQIDHIELSGPLIVLRDASVTRRSE